MLASYAQASTSPDLISVISGRSVAYQDALYLVRPCRRQLGIILHHVAVACVCYEDEFACRKGVEDLVQQELSNAECGIDVTEVERPCVEGTSWIVIKDEVHAITTVSLAIRRCCVSYSKETSD